MFKKTRCVTAVILLMLTATAYAQPKLAGHWAEGELDLKFMELYFPSLVQNSYAAFEPDGSMDSLDFQYALSGLLEVYGYRQEAISTDSKILRRKEAASLVAGALANNGLLVEAEAHNPFRDLDQLTPQMRGSILALNSLGLMQGYSETLFVPLATLTQSQAIILLQRVEQILAKDNIPFAVTDIKTSYSSQQEGVFVSEGAEKVQLRITRCFPTPGYSITVERINRIGSGKYQIHTSVKRPPADAILLQVITYQTLTVELEKKDLGSPPYAFEVI